MAVAMIALPIIGAAAPLAHTAITCLCVCCAHFVSTGLMFRPTGSLVGDGLAFLSQSLMDLWWMMFERRL